jgi:hypothetical protein
MISPRLNRKWEMGTSIKKSANLGKSFIFLVAALFDAGIFLRSPG